MVPPFLKNIIESPKSTAWGVAALVAAALLFGVQVANEGLSTLSSEEGVAALALLVGGVFGLLKEDKKQ